MMERSPRAPVLRSIALLAMAPSASSATYDKVHDPIFTTIELNIDVEGRRATFKVPNTVDARGEPIRNPVTGADHQVLINLPQGFEYTVAEAGRGSARRRERLRSIWKIHMLTSRICI